MEIRQFLVVETLFHKFTISHCHAPVRKFHKDSIIKIPQISLKVETKSQNFAEPNLKEHTLGRLVFQDL